MMTEKKLNYAALLGSPLSADVLKFHAVFEFDFDLNTAVSETHYRLCSCISIINYCVLRPALYGYTSHEVFHLVSKVFH